MKSNSESPIIWFFLVMVWAGVWTALGGMVLLTLDHGPLMFFVGLPYVFFALLIWTPVAIVVGGTTFCLIYFAGRKLISDRKTLAVAAAISASVAFFGVASWAEDSLPINQPRSGSDPIPRTSTTDSVIASAGEFGWITIFATMIVGFRRIDRLDPG